MNALRRSARGLAVLPSAGLVVVALIACSGCGRQSAAAPAAPSGPAAPAVRTVKPARHTFRLTVEEPGQIEAFQQTPIYANIAGYVSEVKADMHAHVKKGALLAKLAVPELEDELKQKEAQVVQAAAELEQEKSALKAAEANLGTARARIAEAEAGRKRVQADYDVARSEYQRTAALTKNKVIALQTLDEAANRLKAAEAGREEIEAKVRTAQAVRDESAARLAKKQADVASARARLEAAQAAARQVRTLLRYTEIKAPFDGVVTRRNVHQGHLLKGGPAAKGEPLFIVVQMDPVRVFIDVPEAEAALVRPGTPVTVRIQALRDREFEGKVVRTSWALEATNRTLKAELELPNPTGELRPGMYAYAALDVAHAGAWALPAAAVVRSDEGTYCNRLVGGKAIRTPLRLGARDGDLVEVIKARLPAPEARAGLRWKDFRGDEAIITSDSATLLDGQTVALADGGR